MFGYIYKITNKINNKSYIGKKYGSFDDNYYGSGKIIKEAIKKYGKENFIIEILCECKNEKDINLNEQKYIKENNPKYNIAKGGTGGNTLLYSTETHKKEIIKKRSISLSKTWNNKSKEEKQKWAKSISLAKKGKKYNRPDYKHSEEVKQKIKLSNQQSHLNRSEEHKQKLLQAAKKRIGTDNPNCWKRVVIDNVIYNSYKEASEKLKVTRQTINHWVKKGKATILCPKNQQIK